MSRTETAGRQVGVWSATALVVGHTIGVGVLLTPAELIGAIGSPVLTIALWIGCGFLVIAGAFTFGELSSRYPVGGGPYIYLREGWGPGVAFLYGWQTLLVMDPGITAALATGLAQYAGLLWPAAIGHERAVAIGVIWMLALLSMTGLTLSTRVLAGMTLFKLLALLAVVALAFSSWQGSWSHFASTGARPPTAVPLGEALALGFVGVFFSFGGFWEASRVAGDVRDARRTMPVALGAGVACVMAIYVATTAAFIYLVPVHQVTSAAAFAQRAGQAMLGPAGPPVLAGTVVLSVVASLLALLIMAPRMYLAMSADGVLPSAVAAVSSRTGSPVRATVLLGALATAFVLVATFQQIVALFMFTTLAFVALAAASIFVVRRRNAGGAGFRAPGYPLTPVLFVLLVLLIVALIAIGRPVQALSGCAIVLLGLPAYYLIPRRV